MKHLIFTLSLFFFFGCFNKHGNQGVTDEFEDVNQYPYRYAPEDSIDFEVPLYKVKEGLYSLLDSIIDIKNSCPKDPRFQYKDEFDFACYSDHQNSLLVDVGTLSTHNFNYGLSCDGIFIYRNYCFNYEGKFLDKYFSKTDKLVKFRIVDPDKFIFDIDDSELYWRYKVTSNGFETIGYVNCDGWWFLDN